MNPLSSFLSKYRRFVKDDSDFKKTVSEILKTKSININPQDIFIKGESLFFSCNPVFRNEIFIRKKEILDLINSNQDRYKFRDVKF